MPQQCMIGHRTYWVVDLWNGDHWYEYGQFFTAEQARNALSEMGYPVHRLRTIWRV